MMTELGMMPVSSRALVASCRGRVDTDVSRVPVSPNLQAAADQPQFNFVVVLTSSQEIT